MFITTYITTLLLGMTKLPRGDEVGGGAGGAGRGKAMAR